MALGSQFPGSGPFSMRQINAFREYVRYSFGRLQIPLRFALAFLLFQGLPAAAAEHTALAIGIIQFPATLNPNIDAMAAKSYVLGLAMRPFTVYDAEWKLVSLLSTKLPSIENGLAVPVDLPDGKKGIDITYTIPPAAKC